MTMFRKQHKPSKKKNKTSGHAESFGESSSASVAAPAVQVGSITDMSGTVEEGEVSDIFYHFHIHATAFTHTSQVYELISVICSRLMVCC